MTNPVSFTHAAFIAGAVFFSAIAANSALAQMGQPPAKAFPEASEPIKLSPFEVKSERDYGYLATNSSTATGSAEPVKNTPMGIVIVTEDFLKDRGALDLRDALRNVSSMSGNNQDAFQVFSRGFQSVLKVDGNEIADGFIGLNNAERVEVIKGPVSVLQGRASAGGVVNVISRRPKFSQQESVDVSDGSFDYRNLSISATGPLLGDKIAYLVGWTDIKRNGWIDLTNRKDQSTQAALTVTPIRSVTLNVDVQDDHRDEVTPQHLTFATPEFLAKDLEGIALYDNKGLPRPASYPQIGETTRSWLNRTPGFGLNAPSETIDVMNYMYPDGYRANIKGPESFQKTDSLRYSADLQWTIAPWLTWKTTYFWSKLKLDNAQISTFRVGGGLTMNTAPIYTRTADELEDTRSELSAHFSALRINHHVLVGFEYREAITGSKTLSGTAFPWNPRKDPERHILAEIRQKNPGGFGVLPRNTNDQTSEYFIDQMEMFDKRLFALVGGRYSTVKQAGATSSRFTPQFGAVFMVPGIEGLGVYASSGESYRPTFTRDGLGNLVPPVIEKNTEGGLKLDLLDGKISGTVTYYRMEQENLPLRDFAREAELGVTPLYNISGLARSSGIESDLIISPARNYQIILSYSRIWEAETVKAEDVRQNGVRLPYSPEYRFGLWNKYTFTSGRPKGLYIGAGARWTGTIRVHPSWASPIDEKPYFYADLLLGYAFNVKKADLDVSFRIENLFNKFYWAEVFRPADPRTAYLALRTRF